MKFSKNTSTSKFKLKVKKKHTLQKQNTKNGSNMKFYRF